MKGKSPNRTQTQPSAAAFDDLRVAAALEQYVTALEAGRTPSRQEFLAKHPEIARELAECLEGLDLVHDAAKIVRPIEPPNSPLSADELKLPLGDFRIVREIGRGGMGVVYEAVQLSLGRRVALKVLPLAAALDPLHLQRFKNEAQAAAQLHHTNIVPVYAVGSERGVHYYSMQLIDGYSLADLITHRRQLLGRAISLPVTPAFDRPTEKATAGRTPPGELLALDQTLDHSPTPPPIIAQPSVQVEVTESKSNSPQGSSSAFASSSSNSPNETLVRSSTFKTASERNSSTYFRTAAGLIRQAALALEHAHQLGVIHRDIKPANLLLDERGNIWVTDFGLALFQANMQLTRTGDMLGTMRYMSPEQASGDRVVLDHRTDIYSLGVTLYELLTLQPAITGADPHTALRRIMEDEPRPPRTIDKHIPLELETIILKAMAKAPTERYTTAAEMADDLQRWLEDQPIRARRPTLLEHAARWSRRHWSLVAASAGILAVATLGLLLSTIIIAREQSTTVAALKGESQQRIAAEKQRLVAIRERQTADQQRKAADESFRQARQAVDAFLGLSEEELANNPSLYQLRRKFLAVALEYYNDFLEQRQDDPGVGEELAQTSSWVRQIVEQLAAIDRFASFLLLTNRFVQEDIGLIAAQREALQDVLSLAEKNDLNWRGEFGPGGAARGIGSSLDQAEQQMLSDQVREFSQIINAVLTPKQIARWQQIMLQQRGPFAFKSPEVVAALVLTADQRKQISAIIEEESPERRGGPGFGRRGMPGHREEFGGPPGFGPGPPPHDGEHGPKGKKGGDFDHFGPPDKRGPGRGPPPRGEFDDFGGRGFGGPGRGGPGGPPPPPPEGEFDNESDDGGFDGPPPGGKKGGGPRGGGPPGGRFGNEDFGPFGPPGGRGGRGFGEGRGGPGGPGGPGPGPPGEMREVSERTIKRIVALLTPEQQAKWKELIGPPFTHELPWRFE